MPDGQPETLDYASRINHDPRDRRMFFIILLSIFGIYCVADLYSFEKAMDQRKPTLKRWLPQAADLGHSDNFYHDHPDYLYPPVFLVLIKPLTWISPNHAAVLWQFAKYVCIVLMFAAGWRAFTRDGRASSFVVLLSILVAARFVHSDLRHGNINIFIAALVIGAGALYVARRSMLAGLFVAIAACIKVTPALWGLYFLYRRDWRALVGCALGAALMLEVIPAAALGAAQNHLLLGQWRSHVIDSFLSGGEIDSIGMNQSLTAVTNRWLGHSSVAPVDRLTSFAFDDPTIHRLQQALAVLLLGLAAIFVRPSRAFDKQAVAVDWALLAPVSLALSGYTWTGHLCLLIPGLIIFFDRIDRSQMKQGFAGPIAICGGLACAIFLFTSDILTRAGREWTTRAGALLLGALLLFAALAMIRSRLRSPATGALASDGAAV